MNKTADEMVEILQAQMDNLRVAAEVFGETNAQLTKWGVQNHPMGTGPELVLGDIPGVQGDITRTVYIQVAALEDWAKTRTDTAARRGVVTYEQILTEEYAEAIAEDDPVRMEGELIQMAAVAVSMVAASRRARGA